MFRPSPVPDELSSADPVRRDHPLQIHRAKKQGKQTTFRKQFPHFKIAERLTGHRGCVNRLLWHPSGEVLASVSDDTNTFLWKHPQKALPKAERNPLSGNPARALDAFLHALLSSTQDEVDGQWHLTSVTSQSAAGEPEVLITGGFRRRRRRGKPVARPGCQNDWKDMPYKYKFSTNHRANIFGVAFLAANCMRGSFSHHDELVTAGLDTEVHRYSLETATQVGLYLCHDRSVECVVTSPDSNNLWWTASEDGTIRQFDKRVPHRCSANNNCNNCILKTEAPECPALASKVLNNAKENWALRRLHHIHARESYSRVIRDRCNLINTCFVRGPRDALCPDHFVPSQQMVDTLWEPRNRTEMRFMSAAINPVRTEYLLVGSYDPLVRVYDRRMLTVGEGPTISGSTPVRISAPPQLLESPYVRHEGDWRFTHTGMRPKLQSNLFTYPTHVQWRDDGREYLATYSNESIYTFPFDSSALLPEMTVFQVPELGPPRDRSRILPFNVPEILFWKGRGREFYKQGQSTNAIVAYTRALELAAPSLSSLLAELSFTESKTASAETISGLISQLWIETVGGSSPPPSISEFIALLKTVETDIPADEASILKLSPLGMMKALRVPLLTNRAVALSSKYRDVRDVSAAIQDFLEAICWAPNEAKPYHGLINSLRIRKDYVSALRLVHIVGNQFKHPCFKRQHATILHDLAGAGFPIRLRDITVRRRRYHTMEDSDDDAQDDLEFSRSDPTSHITMSYISVTGRETVASRGDDSGTLHMRENEAEDLATNGDHSESLDDEIRSDGGADESTGISLFEDVAEDASGRNSGDTFQIGVSNDERSTLKIVDSCFPDCALREVQAQERGQPFAIHPLLHSAAVSLGIGRFSTHIPTSANRHLKRPAPADKKETQQPKRRSVEVQQITYEHESLSSDGEESSPAFRKAWEVVCGQINSDQTTEEKKRGTKERRRCSAHLEGGKNEEDGDEKNLDIETLRGEESAWDRKFWAGQGGEVVESSDDEGGDDRETNDDDETNDDEECSRELRSERLAWAAKIISASIRSLWQPQTQSRRYLGHTNELTDIKEATFWGDEAIIGASDGGAIFVWRRSDGAIMQILNGHRDSVNCVQVHPKEALLVSSGIDDYIQLWRASS